VSDDATPQSSPIEVLSPTPEIFAALAQAQEQARTVKKAGYNQHASYKYATAEDMIAAGRAARKGTGLALLTSWAVKAREDLNGGAPLLTLSWLLTHSSGGILRGSLIAPIQSSKRNGGDKQTCALVTYLEGFVERSLMRLDREGTPPEEDRDSQEDEPEAAPKPGSRAVGGIKAGVAKLHRGGKWDDDAGDRAHRALMKLGMPDDNAAQLLGGWLKALRAEPPQSPPEAAEPKPHAASDETRQAAEDAAMGRAMGTQTLAPMLAFAAAPDAAALEALVVEHAEWITEHAKIAWTALDEHAARVGCDQQRLDVAWQNAPGGS